MRFGREQELGGEIRDGFKMVVEGGEGMRVLCWVG